MEILKIKQVVKEALTEHKSLRNSDNRLVAYLWNKQHPNTQSKSAFLYLLQHGKVMSYESISRVRRKLQELHPELRAEKEVIQARKEEESKVIEQLRIF